MDPETNIELVRAGFAALNAGIPATGRAVSYVSHEFYRIENGRRALSR